MKNDHIFDIYSIEEDLYGKGYKYIAGSDEAGRGPMAGPLVVASVILPVGIKIPYLNDSKKVSPKRRELLFEEIKKVAIDIQVEIISVDEVDKLNVYQASKVGMERTLSRMENLDYALTDCMDVEINVPYTSYVKGDSKSASIASASIIAKVTRDHIMLELDKLYPMYGFSKHKGYVTKLHREALVKYGVSPVHRKTYAPVINEIENNNYLKENL